MRSLYTTKAMPTRKLEAFQLMNALIMLVVLGHQSPGRQHSAAGKRRLQTKSLATQTPKLIGLRLAQGNHQRQTDAPVP